MGIDVRVARQGEWEQSRRIRLEMLADSPASFVERLARVQGWDDDRWRSRHDSSLLPDSTLVAAVDEGRWVGQAAGRRYDSYAEPRAYLLAVYVTPTHRGRRIVGRLVDAVAAWAVDQGMERLWLDVHEDAASARAAYARLGFLETGEASPYVNDPSRRELEMVLDLRG